ncbi:hypothetical protein [Belliella pelovolcani]|uniref:Uncharacterized protein n=1 Tax=Belliella pelovolcani TaxID=529505 RepID=A0A1N7JI96_9BACT|nr:hypothetical protein [Belliella pelovolcani]SIS49047.1 hypothetical protein SAMN05421761_10130 [Belliella pelovolcani]
MKKKILFSLLAGVMALTWNPIESSAEASCDNAKCHSVGMGYCLPGHKISLRASCDYLKCKATADCEPFEIIIEEPEMN